ncbi:MAG TPA: SDR family oxidoreductase, partial [Solimonas sp.]|nr:SDR family oxidoreductase [Solimonas sp.]
TLREAARHMQARAEAGDAGGSLVAVASLAGSEAPGYLESYGATKAGVIAMIKGIAVQMARYGIRANSILPGWIATDMTEELRASSGGQGKLLPRIPMRRWGTPADFGGIAVYLASEASRYHTGDTLVIDGGYAIF